MSNSISSSDLGNHPTARKNLPGKRYKQKNQNAKLRAKREKGYQERREAGICSYCEESVVQGSNLCERHLSNRRSRTRIRYKERKECKVCKHCKAPTEPGHTRCTKCREYLVRHHKEQYRQRVQDGICSRCGKNQVTDGKRNCVSCREEMCRLAAARRARCLEEGVCERCSKGPREINEKHCESCYFRTYSFNFFRNTAEWEKVRDLFNGCGRKCAYTGLPLQLGVNAVLDHKIPCSQGGTNNISNLQWVLGDVNLMKNYLLEEDFFRLIEKIATHRLGMKKPRR